MIDADRAGENVKVLRGTLSAPWAIRDYAAFMFQELVRAC
jgi:hypothetical protein